MVTYLVLGVIAICAMVWLFKSIFGAPPAPTNKDAMEAERSAPSASRMSNDSAMSPEELAPILAEYAMMRKGPSKEERRVEINNLRVVMPAKFESANYNKESEGYSWYVQLDVDRSLFPGFIVSSASASMIFGPKELDQGKFVEKWEAGDPAEFEGSPDVSEYAENFLEFKVRNMCVNADRFVNRWA